MSISPHYITAGLPAGFLLDPHNFRAGRKSPDLFLSFLPYLSLSFEPPIFPPLYTTHSVTPSSRRGETIQSHYWSRSNSASGKLFFNHDYAVWLRRKDPDNALPSLDPSPATLFHVPFQAAAESQHSEPFYRVIT